MVVYICGIGSILSKEMGSFDLKMAKILIMLCGRLNREFFDNIGHNYLEE